MSIMAERIRAATEKLARTKDDAERLGLIRRQLEEVEAELKSFGDERQLHVVAALAGEAEARAAVARIDEDAAAAETRAGDLRQAATALVAALREAAEAESAGAATAKRRQAAGAREAMAGRATRIEALAAELGTELRAAREGMLSLAETSGAAQVKRLADGLPETYLNLLARHFLIHPEGQSRATNSLLRLAPEWAGEMSRKTLAQTVEERLDDTVALFADEGAALACRERLGKRQSPAVVLPLVDGLWLVLPVNQAFATRGAAETALASVSIFRQDHPHAVIEHGGAFVVLRADLGAAVRPEPAAAA